MPNYMLTFLIKDDLDEKARGKIIEDTKDELNHEGKLTTEDLWGERTLAYKIKGKDKAYFVHFEFEAKPQIISSLDKKLKLNENILRYLLIRKD